jgi:mannose-6-phosphate isomerase-like protein (cupin superfamily)
MKRLTALLSIGFAGFCVANDAPPKVEYFSAAQLASHIAHPADGLASKQFLNGPGSNVYIVRRDKTGDAEVHMALNDIFIVKSGHGKITVGGQVSGNRETAPTEWRGGEITGGTDYSLAAGDVLFIPAGVPHKVLVPPKASITYVTVKTPK